MPDAKIQLDDLRRKRDQAKAGARQKRDRLKDAERAQVASIDRRIRRAESKLRGQARRDDTRWKILLGALLESKAAENPKTRDWMLKGLAGYLTKDRDRELAAKMLGPGWDRDGGTGA